MKHLHGKKIVVTGGAGFIGSHLVDALVHQGAQVTVFDNLSTGDMQNLASVQSRIQFIKGNITDLRTCTRVLANQDYVYHLAAMISVAESIQFPEECHRINVQGTQNLLHTAIDNNIQRFIFSSSAAVYGNHEGLCSEDLEGNPTSAYGLSKLHAEQLCHAASAATSLKTICLRYFNVYGPRQNPLLPHAGFVARVRHHMATNTPITLFGDGKQTRDFVSVDEVVKANLLALSVQDTMLDGRPINVGSGTSMPLLALIKQIQQEFPHYNQPIVLAPAREGDIRYSQADCSVLRSLLPKKYI